MIGTIRGLRNEAIREYKIYRLHFDLESNRLWVEAADMTEDEQSEAYKTAFQLPEGVRILDVWRRETGKKTAGQTAIHFTKKGYVEQSIIHLAAEDGREFTLVLSPFLGKVKVYEKYVEIVGI